MILNTEVRSSPGCLWCEWRTFPRPWGRDSFQALSDAKNLRLKRFAELPGLGIQFCCTPSVLGQVGPGHKEQMHTAYSAPVYPMQIQSDIISQTWLQLKSFWVSIVDIPKFWASLPHFLAEAVSWHPHRGAQGKGPESWQSWHRNRMSCFCCNFAGWKVLRGGTTVDVGGNQQACCGVERSEYNVYCICLVISNKASFPFLSIGGLYVFCRSTKGSDQMSLLGQCG